VISDQRDAKCFACHRLVWDLNWTLTELSPDLWKVVCEDCELVLELDEGK
jgi:hypothetical protein